MARRQLVLTLLAVTMATGFSGCAGIDYSKAGPDAEGIRYYRPTTYLLVVPDYEKSAAKVTLIHGPDTSVPYAAKPYAWFATNKTNLEFANGMLTKVSSEAASAKLPQTVITAAVEVTKATLAEIAKKAEVAAALAKAGAAARMMPEVTPAPGDTPPPPVFLFVVTASGIEQ